MELMDLIKSKKAAIAASRRQQTIKPEDGRGRYRILPGWRGADDPTFFHDFGAHFIKGSDGTIKGGGAVYICTDKTFGRPCALCQAVEHAIKATTDDVMVERLKDCRANARVLVNALHVDGEEPNKPEILELAPTAFAEVLNIIQEWGAEVLDLATGRDIIIERTGKGKNTKYSVQVAGKPTVVDKAVMKKIANLDEYVAQESEEMAKRALTSLATAAGLLPAPSAAIVGRPATAPSAAAAMTLVDDAEVVVPPAAPVAPVAPAASKPVAPAAPAGTSTEELDALLADLDK